MLRDKNDEIAERLRAELKTIELWDEAFLRNPNHEWWETVAFANRRQRKSEILRHLAMADIWED